MYNPVQDIISALVPEIPEGQFIASEYDEAYRRIRAIDKHIVSAIPHCIFEFVRDEEGELVLSEQISQSGEVTNPIKRPVRLLRMDILIILVQIAARREQPDITEEQIGAMINNDNLNNIIDACYAFWGTPFLSSKYAIEPAETEQPEELEEVEAKSDPLSY